MPRFIRALVGLCFPAIVGGIVFLAAGRIDLPFVWAILALLGVTVVAGGFLVDPSLMKERLQPGAGALRDYHRALSIPVLLAHWILTGLDLGRYHWSDTVPVAAQYVGLAGYALGLAITFWAMVANRFYSSVVRIQTDRGHEPITVGPYRYIRHPGYAAALVCGLAAGLALGSWIGAAPLAVLGLLFVRRTVNEDRLLQRELPGYAEYASRVRYRLLPGVW